jgi:hypothetical protein
MIEGVLRQSFLSHTLASELLNVHALQQVVNLVDLGRYLKLQLFS